MTELRTATAIEHCCFRSAGKDGEGGSSTPVGQALLSDRQKISLVLQAAALMAHLQRAGWHLTMPLPAAAVDSSGCLVVTESAEPGQDVELPQKRLAAFLESLFGGEPRGRGQARGFARRLLEDWRQTLTPLPATRAVEQIMEGAPFLATSAFAGVRTALAAFLRYPAAPGVEESGSEPLPCELSVVGPKATRDALLRGLPAAPEGAFEVVLERLQQGDRYWSPRASSKKPAASTSITDGMTQKAATKVAAPQRLLLAQQAFEAGRFQDVLTHLKGARSAAARRLRAWSQYYLGERGAALDGVRRLRAAPTDDAERVELIEIGSRCLAAMAQRPALQQQLDTLTELAQSASENDVRLRAGLLAAEIAWDLDDADALRTWLERVETARDHAELGWRWHQVRALQALLEDNASGAEEWLSQALRLHRRQLRGFEAAGLWNDLGMSRAQRGDLAAAERAFRHTQRLFASTQDPRRDTIARANLAEIRLRRGRLRGVRASLERSSAASRRSGNLRSSLYDYGLWARYELTLGRAEAALAHLREAQDRLYQLAPDWRIPETLRVLAARAHGWLGHTAAAARELEAGGKQALSELEPEERPAVLAAAGLLDEALAAAAGTPYADLWTGLLSGKELPETAWKIVDDLEPFRAARLVFDFELLRPGSVPPSRRRRAAQWLRGLGADGAASHLELRDQGPWQALERYWRADTADRPGMLSDVFAACGHAAAELWWQGLGEAPRRVLAATRRDSGAADTPTSVDVLEWPLPAGCWQLRTPATDNTARALLALIVRDLEPPDSGTRRVERSSARDAGMLGDSPELRRCLDRLRLLAAGDLPLLLRGESGTGKELAARWAHRLSRRCREKFLPLNCAALSETLVLSDLFGHARGAFTGADQERAGIFEAAGGGTVFLDEIGDLPATAQGMLLRVLQEGEIRRLGESQARKVDVRVITATHRDLAEMVEAGSFRQDLFFRLKVAAIELPPLRQRGDDVLLLAEHFLRQCRLHDERRPDRGGTPSAEAPSLEAGAREALRRYPWPGNVRELQNVMHVAAALAQEGTVTAQHLDLGETQGTSAPSGDYHQQVEAFRRRLVHEALEASGGNQAAAARQLGLTRQALSYLVRQLDLL